jgi:hypothetical protein
VESGREWEEELAHEWEGMLLGNTLGPWLLGVK